MLDQSPDELFGVPRPPSHVERWEDGYTPRSLSEFNSETAETLIAYLRAATSPLLINNCKSFQFIWAMDENCRIWIGVEEFSPWRKKKLAGIARLEQFKTRKLGHPTLLRGGAARIAGELYLDDAGEGVKWFINSSSGRYCRQLPPSADQLLALKQRFVELLGRTVELDEEP